MTKTGPIAGSSRRTSARDAALFVGAFREAGAAVRGDDLRIHAHTAATGPVHAGVGGAAGALCGLGDTGPVTAVLPVATRRSRATSTRATRTDLTESTGLIATAAVFGVGAG